MTMSGHQNEFFNHKALLVKIRFYYCWSQ